jgi:hypothetical protein
MTTNESNFGLSFKEGVTRDTAIRDLVLDEGTKAALVIAGYTTVGELEDRKIGPMGYPGRLTLIKGINGMRERLIEEALYADMVELND